MFVTRVSEVTLWYYSWATWLLLTYQRLRTQDSLTQDASPVGTKSRRGRTCGSFFHRKVDISMWNLKGGIFSLLHQMGRCLHWGQWASNDRTMRLLSPCNKKQKLIMAAYHNIMICGGAFWDYWPNIEAPFLNVLCFVKGASFNVLTTILSIIVFAMQQ